MHTLELFPQVNTWTPPEIDEYDYALSALKDLNAGQNDQFLYIFRTVPYIDSVYVEYDSLNHPSSVRRFTFHEGYRWDAEDEEFFIENCVKEEKCSYNGGVIDEIYERCLKERPEWHVKRYYTKSLRLLDHIYNCMRKNTAKEMLYKAGLDELAAHVDDIDELNLLASKPSEIYDGITMKVLRSLNCSCGAALLEKKARRDFVKDLNQKFPDLFKERLNDAQCSYLMYLIKGDLTAGEVGRLFQARRRNLSYLWTMSQVDLFLQKEKQEDQIRKICKVLEKMDPIYRDYVKDIYFDILYSDNIKHLEYYLLIHREEYDKLIRRSNRKRDYNLQERCKDYYVRYPQTINDLCREAVYMRNCLMTYIDAIIKNDTTILFMRKADDVNTPFITLEIFDGKLMQAYHHFNEDCSPDEAEWIRNYCKRHNIGTDKFKFNADVDELF